MPLVNIKVPEGSLTPEKKQRMIELVTDAVVEAEGFSGNERVREITWITIDEVPEGNWGAAGETVTLKKLGKYVTGDKSITESFASEKAAAGAPS
jgi:4-oxalocrotonate tautomerase